MTGNFHRMPLRTLKRAVVIQHRQSSDRFLVGTMERLRAGLPPCWLGKTCGFIRHTDALSYAAALCGSSGLSVLDLSKTDNNPSGAAA